jgi:hypothetical protein
MSSILVSVTANTHNPNTHRQVSSLTAHHDEVFCIKKEAKICQVTVTSSSWTKLVLLQFSLASWARGHPYQQATCHMNPVSLKHERVMLYVDSGPVFFVWRFRPPETPEACEPKVLNSCSCKTSWYKHQFAWTANKYTLSAVEVCSALTRTPFLEMLHSTCRSQYEEAEICWYTAKFGRVIHSNIHLTL